MTVMKRMYPQIVDKENFASVVNKLFSSFDRDKMKEYIQLTTVTNDRET